jgi:hypothetical protein
LELLTTVVSALLPACMTFGPLFLVVEGKTPRYTRLLRGVGVGMVMLALGTSWLMIESQRGEISVLSHRLDNLERASSPGAAQSAPCPP